MVEKARTMSLIFGGMCSGIFGLDAFQGFVFYFGLITFVTLVIVFRIGFKA